jgi:hypothetical protein
MTGESIVGNPLPQMAGRARRGLLVAVAAAAFAWFFIAVMIDPRSGFWLMPVGVAVAAVLLGVSLPLDRWWFVWMLCVGLVAGLALDLLVRGLPLLLISQRWDWMSGVFLSTALGCMAGIFGGICSTLAGWLFRPRPT